MQAFMFSFSTREKEMFSVSDSYKMHGRLGDGITRAGLLVYCIEGRCYIDDCKNHRLCKICLLIIYITVNNEMRKLYKIFFSLRVLFNTTM